MTIKPECISLLYKELITCGAVLSGFELVQALRKLGHEVYIVSNHNNKELEEYFGIEVIREPKGITITSHPKIEGDWAYVRTKDERWKTHKEPKIAVSQWIADWIGTDIVLGNGTHERFYDMRLERDIDCLIIGNYEPNKNIEGAIERAKDMGCTNILWFGRSTVSIPGVDTISNPPITEIPRIYNRAKMVISVSREEGWGRPIAESMACGVPRVINENGGNRQIEIVSWESIANKLIEIICKKKN